MWEESGEAVKTRGGESAADWAFQDAWEASGDNAAYVADQHLLKHQQSQYSGAGGSPATEYREDTTGVSDLNPPPLDFLQFGYSSEGQQQQRDNLGFQEYNNEVLASNNGFLQSNLVKQENNICSFPVANSMEQEKDGSHKNEVVFPHYSSPTNISNGMMYPLPVQSFTQMRNPKNETSGYFAAPRAFPSLPDRTQHPFKVHIQTITHCELECPGLPAMHQLSLPNTYSMLPHDTGHYIGHDFNRDLQETTAFQNKFISDGNFAPDEFSSKEMPKHHPPEEKQPQYPTTPIHPMEFHSTVSGRSAPHCSTVKGIDTTAGHVFSNYDVIIDGIGGKNEKDETGVYQREQKRLDDAAGVNNRFTNEPPPPTNEVYNPALFERVPQKLHFIQDISSNSPYFPTSAKHCYVNMQMTTNQRHFHQRSWFNAEAHTRLPVNKPHGGDEEHHLRVNDVTSSQPIRDVGYATETSGSQKRSRSRSNKKVSEPKKFSCTRPKCNKRFAKEHELQIHVNKHHVGMEKPYFCSYSMCTKSFKRPDQLKRHQKIHTGEKPHECSVCGRRFARTDHRNTHTSKHNGENVHVCLFPSCNLRFSKLEDLRHHKTSHTQSADSSVLSSQSVGNLNFLGF